MPNIFEIRDNAELTRRIESLTPEAKARWGKMNVSQMIVHAQKPLEVAEGTLFLKGGLISFLFGKMAKKSFLKNPEFKKNLPTAPAFKITHEADFEKEKEILLQTVVRFREKGTAVIQNKKHPFFGELSDEEWGILQYKHLDHHLRQFGV